MISTTKKSQMVAVTLLLFASSCVTVAQSASTVQAVLEAERRGRLAYQSQDVQGIRNFLTDNYTLTDSKGNVTTKQDDVDDFLQDRIRYTTFQNARMKVRLYRNTATVTARLARWEAPKALFSTSPCSLRTRSSFCMGTGFSRPGTCRVCHRLLFRDARSCSRKNEWVTPTHNACRPCVRVVQSIRAVGLTAKSASPAAIFSASFE